MVTLADPSRRPYRVLGKVFAYDKINNVFAVYEEQAMWEHLKLPAAQLGADAIIGAQANHRLGGVFAGETYQMWASALAVRFDDGGASDPFAHMVSIKGIKRPSWYEREAEDWAEDVLVIRATARYLLEEAGYYAVFEEDNRHLKTPLELQLEILAVDELDLAIAGRGSAALRGTLRPTGGGDARVITRGAAIGTSGFVWTLAADLRRGALAEAVGQVVKELPAVKSWESD